MLKGIPRMFQLKQLPPAIGRYDEYSAEMARLKSVATSAEIKRIFELKFAMEAILLQKAEWLDFCTKIYVKTFDGLSARCLGTLPPDFIPFTLYLRRAIIAGRIESEGTYPRTHLRECDMILLDALYAMFGSLELFLSVLQVVLPHIHVVDFIDQHPTLFDSLTVSKRCFESIVSEHPQECRGFFEDILRVKDVRALSPWAGAQDDKEAAGLEVYESQSEHLELASGKEIDNGTASEAEFSDLDFIDTQSADVDMASVGETNDETASEAEFTNCTSIIPTPIAQTSTWRVWGRTTMMRPRRWSCRTLIISTHRTQTLT